MAGGRDERVNDLFFLPLSGEPDEEGQVRNTGSDIKAYIGGSSKSLTAGAGGGEANYGQNVGTGEGLVYRDKTGVVLNFKKLQQAGAVTITNEADQLIISSKDTRILSFSFAHGDVDSGLIVSASSYEAKGNVIWPGSTYIGSPTNIKASGLLAGGTGGYLKIYDVTNANQIAEGYMTTVGSWIIFDLGTLSNISTGEAVWELQMRSTGTPKAPEFIVGAMEVLF